MPKRKKDPKMSALAKQSWHARRGIKLLAFIKTVGEERVVYANYDGENLVFKGKTGVEALNNLFKILKEKQK